MGKRAVPDIALSALLLNLSVPDFEFPRCPLGIVADVRMAVEVGVGRASTGPSHLGVYTKADGHARAWLAHVDICGQDGARPVALQ